ncbi:MAG: ATP-dependent helicase HrpB [Hyphomicrobiaceae bacterium]
MAKNDLPIEDVLPEITAVLAAGTSAVLVAPPGAGKTTRVPLALLDAPWLTDRKILVLEPRRLAARAAAERMASLLGERVGDRVGLRARLDTRVGPKTRIEVVTEGVFTRLILADPELAGVGAILFDEFHERSLDADLGLALALDARAGLREDLRILVMSATLDGARVARLMGDTPVVASEGRAFSVETLYLGQGGGARIEDRVADAIRLALTTEAGSILAFLPGQGEIMRVAERLGSAALPSDVDIVPLYGALDAREQQRAIAPPPPNRRKVVLATSIAETSITIDGVRVVIDSGLERSPRYEPDVGITRLVTQRVSRASADQRRGRAGRTEPGVCWRLWDEPQTAGLLPFREPEIKAADLTALLLDCVAWGVADPLKLAWLDPPPAGALAAARSELTTLGAIDDRGALTDMGHRLRRLPVPPRLARMIVGAAPGGHAVDAAMIAAILVERGLGGTGTDLDQRLAAFARDRSRRSGDMRALARGWAEIAEDDARSIARASVADSPSTAALLATAYPDRIAMARGAPGQYLLANGRAAMLDAADSLALAPFLVVAEVSGVAARARILTAAATNEAEVRVIAADRIGIAEEAAFDAASAAVRTRRTERLGAIALRSETRPTRPGPEVATLLARGIASLGIDRLPWSSGQRQLRTRIAFVRGAAKDPDAWPDLSDAMLAATVTDWLAPFLDAATSLADIKADLLGTALDGLLPWSVRDNLSALAPTHFTAPTGKHHSIDYEGDGAPILAIRVQELFGLTVHPAIANGRLPLTLHLLSPAHRPIQITRDLPGFWAGSWADVRADMRGRYPRHPWPEDPRSAPPTSRAKPRGT